MNKSPPQYKQINPHLAQQAAKHKSKQSVPTKFDADETLVKQKECTFIEVTGVRHPGASKFGDTSDIKPTVAEQKPPARTASLTDRLSPSDLTHPLQNSENMAHQSYPDRERFAAASDKENEHLELLDLYNEAQAAYSPGAERLSMSYPRTNTGYADTYFSGQKVPADTRDRFHSLQRDGTKGKKSQLKDACSSQDKDHPGPRGNGGSGTRVRFDDSAIQSHDLKEYIMNAKQGHTSGSNDPPDRNPIGKVDIQMSQIETLLEQKLKQASPFGAAANVRTQV